MQNGQIDPCGPFLELISTYRDRARYDAIRIGARNPQVMDEASRQALVACSKGAMTAIELRRRLGDASYGDVLRLLSEENLPLPRAPVERREADCARARARAWMFPKSCP